MHANTPPKTTEQINQALLIRVAIPGPLRQFFDYKAKNGTLPESHPIGSRVEVPFGRSRKVGIVIEHCQNHTLADEKIKAVLKQLDQSNPTASTSMMQLARWLADYYHHPLGDCLATLLPKLLTKLPSKAKQSSVGYTQRIWSITALGQGLSDHALSRAPKQQALILDLQKQNPNGLSDEELRAQGHTLQSARELARKALIDSRQQQFVPADCAALIQGTGNDNKLALNNEQQIALEGVEQNFGQFAVSLLEGITGSGKTEVYLQAIEHIIANRQQVLVLVPEIGLTPQTVARFANRFNCQIAVLHSNLNDNERLAAWQSARCGQAQIIIGTRSAVFSPLIRPGLIIVDEEHDNSYKQQEGLRYHARDVAIMRGQFEAIPVLLGSATPSLESLQNAVRGKFHHLHLKQRAGGAKPAEIEFIDLRQQVLHEGLADQSIQAIADTLAAGEQALVFINRRGFAPLLMCQDCGWSAECHNCDARLTLHMAAKHMRCHHCDQVAAIPNHCPRCQSTQIQYLGQGTERSSEALRKLFPDTDVIRIDRDTSRKKSALTNYIAAINSNKSLIVVGTQMLAKGHDFKNLNTVIVLNVDDALYQADFRATEKTLQLLTQVSGRAGRSSQKGRVLIQTHLPDHPLLQSWAEHSYQGVSREMLQERENRGMPPYNYLALLRADSTQSQQAIQFLQQTANLLKTQYAPQSQLIGPLPALMEKRAGRHRAQLVFNAASRKQLHNDIDRLLGHLAKTRTPNGLRWSIDIDPQEAF